MSDNVGSVTNIAPPMEHVGFHQTTRKTRGEKGSTTNTKEKVRIPAMAGGYYCGKAELAHLLRHN